MPEDMLVHRNLGVMHMYASFEAFIHSFITEGSLG